jgi:hypothetical protein
MGAYLISGVRLRVMGSLILGACVLALPLPATSLEAQLPGRGASCFMPPAKLADQAARQFLANSDGLLAAQPNGGITFQNFVRSLEGSDLRTVGPLNELARNAAPAVKAEIATELANTVVGCDWSRPWNRPIERYSRFQQFNQRQSAFHARRSGESDGAIGPGLRTIA